MRLNTDKKLSDDVITAMHRYLGNGFMGNDNTGKSVIQVIREWESTLRWDAESTCEKISIMVLGGNLPHQVERIKDLKFL